MIKMESYAVFDIETVAAYKNLSEAPAHVQSLWNKRCGFFRERYSDNAIMSDEQLWEKKAALHAEFAKIACVSFGIVKNNETIIKSSCSHNELEVLNWAKNTINAVDKLGLNLAGHTIERFDIPFLFKRFLINKIQPPSLISVWNKKPWDLTFFDVAKFWSNGAWQESFTSLDTMAMVFDVASPKMTTQGSDVYSMYWNTNQLDLIQTYCEGDVRATMEIMRNISNVTEIVTA